MDQKMIAKFLGRITGDCLFCTSEKGRIFGPIFVCENEACLQTFWRILSQNLNSENVLKSFLEDLEEEGFLESF